VMRIAPFTGFHCRERTHSNNAHDLRTTVMVAFDPQKNRAYLRYRPLVESEK